jgi:hypothetical protein
MKTTKISTEDLELLCSFAIDHWYDNEYDWCRSCGNATYGVDLLDNFEPVGHSKGCVTFVIKRIKDLLDKEE